VALVPFCSRNKNIVKVILYCEQVTAPPAVIDDLVRCIVLSTMDAHETVHIQKWVFRVDIGEVLPIVLLVWIPFYQPIVANFFLAGGWVLLGSTEML